MYPHNGIEHSNRAETLVTTPSEDRQRENTRLEANEVENKLESNDGGYAHEADQAEAVPTTPKLERIYEISPLARIQLDGTKSELDNLVMRGPAPLDHQEIKLLAKRYIASLHGSGTYLFNITGGTLYGGTNEERGKNPPPRIENYQCPISVKEAKRIRLKQQEPGGLIECGLVTPLAGLDAEETLQERRERDETDPFKLKREELREMMKSVAAEALAGQNNSKASAAGAEEMPLSVSDRIAMKKLELDEKRLDEERDWKRAQAEREEQRNERKWDAEQQRNERKWEAENDLNQRKVAVEEQKNRDSLVRAGVKGTNSGSEQGFLEKMQELKTMQEFFGGGGGSSNGITETIKSWKELSKLQGVLKEDVGDKKDDDENKMSPAMQLTQGILSDIATLGKQYMEAKSEGDAKQVEELGSKLAAVSEELIKMKKDRHRETAGSHAQVPPGQQALSQPQIPRPAQVQPPQNYSTPRGKAQPSPASAQAPPSGRIPQPAAAQQAHPQQAVKPKPQRPSSAQQTMQAGPALKSVPVPPSLDKINASTNVPQEEEPMPELPAAPENIDLSSTQTIFKYLHERTKTILNWDSRLRSKDKNGPGALDLYTAMAEAEVRYLTAAPDTDEEIRALGSVAELEPDIFLMELRKTFPSLSPMWVKAFKDEDLRKLLSEIHNGIRHVLKDTRPDHFSHFNILPFGKVPAASLKRG